MPLVIKLMLLSIQVLWWSHVLYSQGFAQYIFQKWKENSQTFSIYTVKVFFQKVSFSLDHNQTNNTHTSLCIAPVKLCVYMVAVFKSDILLLHV